MKRLVAVLVAVLPIGCASIKEPDRELNQQNVYAGAFIEATSVDPAIKQAGKDVKENAEALKLVIGAPEKTVAYSPKASADARKASQDAHAMPWWGYIAGLGSIILGWLGKGKLAAIFPRLFGGPVGVGLSALTETLARLRQSARVNGSVTEGDILGLVTKVSEREDIRAFLRKYAQQIELKYGIDLSPVLGQPEPEKPPEPPAPVPTGGGE